MPSATALIKRRDALKSASYNHLRVAQDIAEVVAPHKSDIIVQRSPGQKRTDRLFDGTALHSKNLLRASLHQTLTPATQPWLSLKLRDEALNEQEDVALWTEDTARRIHLALRQSNFNTAVDEMYDDLVTFGTGCLFCEENDPEATGRFGGLNFQAVPYGHFFVSEDRKGKVDTVFYDFKLPARVILDTWPKTPSEFAQKYRTKPDEMIEILYCAMPRQDLKYADQGGKVTRKPGKTNMPWATYYILVESKALLEEGGEEEFPFMVPRWSKSAGEVLGSGPSHVALPDALSAQVMMEAILKAVPLAIIPPLLTRSESVVGDMDRSPGALNEVDTMGGPIQDAIQPLNTGYKPDVAEAFFQRIDAKIQQYYFVDQLILRDKPDMTATEINARIEQNQRLLGPTTGRLESEFLNRLVERVFGLMARVAGALLPLPKVLAQAGDAADLDIEYEGPLARAQRMIELNAQDRVLQMVAGVSQGLASIAPDKATAIWDVIDLDKFVRARAAITGLPTDNLVSEEKVQEVRDGRAAQQQKQQQLQAAGQVGEIAKNVAPFIQATNQGGPAGATGPLKPARAA